MKAGAAGHIIGRKAETLACDYLREKDYRIICRNYRSTYGEIDIVRRSDRCLYLWKCVTGSAVHC